MSRTLLILPLLLILGACSSEDEDKDTGTGTGNTGGSTNMDGPIVGTNPMPLCTSTVANNQGVGKVCTKAGNECVGTTSPTCVADPPANAPAPHFCTKICAKNSDCGADANCCLVNRAANIATCAPKGCGCPTPQ